MPSASVFQDVKRDDGLTPGQHRLVIAGRQAMARVLLEGAGPDEATLLSIVAHVGAAADIIAASVGTGARDLVAVINQQLAGCGYQLVPVSRN